MWDSRYLMDVITRFMPPFSKFIFYEKPFRRPALGMADIDGDGIVEIVGAYNWQGQNYLIVLKYYNGTWQVIDTIKGMGPSREELVRIWHRLCEFQPFVNRSGIDLSSIKYICSETKRDIKLERALIKEFELDSYQDNVRYYYNKVDLNGDGIDEIFVYLVGPSMCGTGGCSGAVFKQGGQEYSLLSKFSLVNNPVIISNSKTKGYRDIVMNVYGGGIESFFALLKYNGITYPSNPSIQPKLKAWTKVEGIAIVADDIAKNPGIKL